MMTYTKQEIFNEDGGILKAEHLRRMEEALVASSEDLADLDERLGYVEGASTVSPEVLSGLYQKFDQTSLVPKKAYTNIVIGKGILAYASSGMGNSASEAIPVKAGTIVKINGRTVGATQLIAITDEHKICYARVGAGVLADTELEYVTKFDGYLFVTAVADDNFYLELISPSILNNIVMRTGGRYTTPCTPRCPTPQLPGDGSEGSDFDVENVTSSEIDAYMDELVSTYPDYITKEELGLDASGKYKVYRYILGNFPRQAWVLPNQPNMYAFENGTSLIYFTSISPRIGDVYYSTTNTDSPSTAQVTAVNATNQSVTIEGKEYVPNPLKNVRANCVYTRGLDYGTNSYCANQVNTSLTRVTEWGEGTITTDGKVYHRYPIGDRPDQGEAYTTNIVIWGNEHGPTSDPANCAVVLARMAKDLCDGTYKNNEMLSYLRRHCKIVLIPQLNPYGVTERKRNNVNNVNINRNYNTPGWDLVSDSDKGAYPGSEIETQYAMNTLADVSRGIGMSLHCLGHVNDSVGKKCHWAGYQYKEYVEDIRDTMWNEYGLYASSYGTDAPEENSQSIAFIRKLGREGALLEFQARDASNDQLFTARAMEQNYTFLLNCLLVYINRHLGLSKD